jgi:hypothetical protein
MFQRIFIAGFAVAILCATVNVVHAQSRGGSSAFGSGGMSGGSFNTSMGGGGFGSSSFGSGGFGGSRFGSSGSGSSGFGSSGFGSSPFGNSGFSNQGGNRTGQGGQGGQQGFIGRDGGDIQNLFNQLGRGGNNQNMNRMAGGGNNQARNRSGRGSQNGNQQGQNEKPPVMVRLQVAFDRPLSGEGRLTGDNLGLKLRKILDDHSITQPDVSVDGGVVVLRGTATSESERLVLEKLIAIEPGVREVQNLMTVAQAPNG